MRKRFDPMWRIAVALLVVIALAPIAVSAGVTQADDPVRPETYMDPIPDYINYAAAMGPSWLNGTSLDSMGSSVIVDVQCMIIRNSDGYRWIPGGGGTWVDVPDAWTPINPQPPLPPLVRGDISPDWHANQWEWGYLFPIWRFLLANDLTSGESYTVKARAMDALGFLDETPAVDTFIFDNESPDVSFFTTFSDPMYDLDEIIGTASDDPDNGEVNQVRLMIQMDPLGVPTYWNGYHWGTHPKWILATGTTSWEIDRNTDPPIPEWQNNQTYRIDIGAVDDAGNRDNTLLPFKQFAFRAKRTMDGVTLNPFPDYINASYFGGGPGQFWIAGTSRPDLGATVFEVRVRIRDMTEGKYYDGDDAADGAPDGEFWETMLDWDEAPLAIPGNAWDNHEDWLIKPVHITNGYPTWEDGHSYQIQVRMEETDGSTYMSNMESFVYDITFPDSNIDAFDDIVYNSLTSITGVSGQDPGLTGFNAGEIGGVIMRIQRDPGGPQEAWWDGAGWGPTGDEWMGVNPWWYWVFATPQDGNYNEEDEEWMVTSTTSPPLPEWVNNMTYFVDVRAFDQAGNREATDAKQFEFRIELEGYTPPPPVGPTPTPGPTGTPGPTEPTPEPSPVEPTPTQPTPTPTATVAPTETQTVTPTQPTPTPEYQYTVTKTIGAGGGKICLEDNRVCIDFPAGAFSSSTEVTITLDQEGGTICLDVPEGYFPGNTCFTVSPSQELGAAADVCVRYTTYEYNNAAQGDASLMKLAYKEGGTWNVLKTTVDTTAGTACAQTTHLSTWVLAIEEETEGIEWLWWYWLLIGLVALLVIIVIVLLFVRPRGEGGEEGEEAYEEEI